MKALKQEEPRLCEQCKHFDPRHGEIRRANPDGSYDGRCLRRPMGTALKEPCWSRGTCDWWEKRKEVL